MAVGFFAFTVGGNVLVLLQGAVQDAALVGVHGLQNHLAASLHGTASITLGCGVTVGAIVAVNACGDVYEANTDKVLACGHLADGKPVLCDHLLYGSAPIPEMLKIGTPSGQNTTIGVVATDAVLTKAQALRMATCAHDGYARTIRPVHTQMDGDTVFALGTGRIDADVNPVQLCAAAAEVTARAIQNALWAVQHP